MPSLLLAPGHSPKRRQRDHLFAFDNQEVHDVRGPGRREAPPKIEEGSPDQPLQQDHVSISISSRSSSYLSYYGFVGSVSESKSENIQPGDIVTGVTKEDNASPITCFSGCIASVSEGMNTKVVANNSLALVIASLILGPGRGLGVSTCIPPLKIVLVNDDDLAEDLSSILSLVPNLATVSRHDSPLGSQSDIVVSSFEESETTLNAPAGAATNSCGTGLYPPCSARVHGVLGTL